MPKPCLSELWEQLRCWLHELLLRMARIVEPSEGCQAEKVYDVSTSEGWDTAARELRQQYSIPQR